MKYKFVKLSNGAQLAYVKNNISKTTNVRLNFDCGARCDGEIPGLAHFVEHMFFSGTKALSKDEISKKYFDLINVNASTSDNNINFTGNVFTKEFGEYLSTVATMITESTFTQDAVNKEVGVVHQEITRDNDDYQYKAYEFNYYNLMHRDVDKNSILGNKESISSIKSNDVKKFVKKYFVSNNLYVYVSSPLSVTAVKNLIEKNLLSRLSIDNKFKPLPYFYGNVVDDQFLELKNQKIDKNYIFINFVCDRNYLEIEFKEKVSVILKMMRDYSEGILKYIRLKKSLVYSASFYTRYDDKNMILTFKTECESKNVNELIKTVAEYLNEKKLNGFTQSQLDKTKRLITYAEHEEEPRVMNEFRKLFDFKKYNKVLDYKKLEQLRKDVKLDEINAIYNEIMDKSRVSLSIYGNMDKKDLITKKEFNNLFNKK